MRLTLSLVLLFICGSSIAQKYPDYWTKAEIKEDKWIKKMEKKIDAGDVVAMYELAEYFMSDDSYRQYVFIPLLQKAWATGKCPECWERIINNICEQRSRSRYPGRVDIERVLDTTGKCTASSVRLAEEFRTGMYGKGPFLDSAVYFAERGANFGDSAAMYFLGSIYEYHDRLFPEFWYFANKDKAKFWYKEAAARGNKEAIERLDILAKAADSSFEKGMAAYNAKNYKDALYWWEICASGNNSGAAYFNAGLIYYLGLIDGVADKIFAARSFESAGYNGIADGFYYAARIWASEGSRKTALELYKKAADMGHKEAALAKADIEADVAAYVAQRDRQTAKYLESLKQQSNQPSSPGVSTSKSEKPQKWCSACSGSGKTHTTIYGGQKGPGNTTSFGSYSSCSACGGKGYTY